MSIATRPENYVTVALEDYRTRFKNIRLERDEQGILLVTLQTDGGPMIWNILSHDELAACWDAVARDPANKVVIVTGTDDEFLATHNWDGADELAEAATWHRLHNAGKRLLMSHLDIEVPMIAAVNGHATVHSEQALLCDIVLAADTAEWAEMHFTLGLPPGDGVQWLWNHLAGFNRGRYLMLTGERISSATACDYGMVAEVLPKDRVLERAYELARSIAAKPDLVLRSSRMLLTHEIKRELHEVLGYGLMTEAVISIDNNPLAKPH